MSVSKKENKEINSSRIFNASRDLVWEVWSRPEHLAKWWGPKGFKNTFNKHEFKNGGVWSFVMHGPDGTDFQNEMVYVEIMKPSKIILDHVTQPKFKTTVTFEEMGKRTKVNFNMLFESEQICDAVKNVAILGNEENFDRMEALMCEMNGAVLPKEFILTRTYNASAELMWKMWTEPTHMAKWWGPKEVKVGQYKMDFCRGGTYHYCMITPDGGEMWGKFYYLDIVKNKRMMFINTFSDKNGGMTRHPMSPQWPLQLLSTISFEEQSNKTKLTIRWYPINATEDEIKHFNDGHASMNQGWGGSLERLGSLPELTTCPVPADF